MRFKPLLVCVTLTVAFLAGDAWAQSIAINFGADEPDGARSDVAGPAGVLGTANWNNLDLLSGTAAGLVNSDGVATGVSVEWLSNNTWASAGRGEDNNTAPPGDDRNLMTGYLDTAGAGGQGVQIDVSGLSAAITEPAYDVYVYTKGGVIGRGGEYVIGAETQEHTDTAPFDGTYVLGSEGDYLIFEGVSGDSFTLTTIPTIGAPERAPVNAIEIVGVPEPSSVILLLSGLLSLGLIRRKRG
jgi:hypothetical protein